MKKKLTANEIESLSYQIDNEGFDYYFTDYGPDKVLRTLCGDEIKNYLEARSALRVRLTELGLTIE